MACTLARTNDPRGWLDATSDDDQLIAELHSQPGNRYRAEACGITDVRPLADRVPALMSELGQGDGGDRRP